MESTYRYMNGTPTLIKEIQYDYNTEKKVWHVTVRETVNGTLQVTGEYEEE